MEYVNGADLTDTAFLFEMISKNEFVDYHKEVDNFEFRVTDRKKKTDEDVLIFLKKHYNIDNAKSIAKLQKAERDNILAKLKKEFPVRQLQRITGVSRGVITKAE